MAIEYDVFAGDSSGGPVDYTSSVLTTSGLSAALAPLAPGTSTRFGVRARDTVTGLVDTNTDAQVLITVGDDGSDKTDVPAAPQSLRAFASPGGAARAEWAWPYPTGPYPAGFRVYLWPASGPPDYTAPAATAPFGPGKAFGADIAGLAGGTAYRVAVRAYNASGEEANTASVSVTGVVDGPDPVTGLTAAAGY